MRTSTKHWLFAALLGLAGSVQAAPACGDWPDWGVFKQRFLSDGGRVIDRSMDNLQTTSEGQSYALFFALVANDRASFDKVLNWTRDNLAGGDLTARLPAWQWGKRDDGSWNVIDSNTASDADLWIAYSLIEAGRLWQEPRYTALGKLIGQRILREETAELPGLGLTLLPGMKGFQSEPTLWRLNPSYVPLQLVERMARALPNSGWTKLLASSEKLILKSGPKGYAPDWVGYRSGKGFVPDAKTKAVGSFDAIRVYTWVGMLSPDLPGRIRLLNGLAPMGALVAQRGAPPTEVDTVSGQAGEAGPVGFSMAMLPFLIASGQKNAADEQLTRLAAKPLAERPQNYYEHVLSLFGLGWQQQRYAFNRYGEVRPHWETACASPRSSS
ncbi:cellulose synthase complex periplasmic endoglucanase BcsZ [Neisseriaceae bacterium JH1-16]|nr:cellulose synthase complex periplasmic endoglucanase BcsZ [Neisseriaceae bacterium JH1-16]